jgi:hypothetical protein
MQFAPCPPAFGLLLYLRKSHRHSEPARRWFAFVRLPKTLLQLEAWYVCRSEIKGEPAKQAEDIRGDGYTVALAGSEKS